MEQENDWFKFYYATYYKKSPYHRRAVEAGLERMSAPAAATALVSLRRDN